ELALPIVAGAADRLALLCVRDEALEMLRRPAERLEGLAELNALTEAIGEPHLEFDVMLRRSAALRSANEDDRAAEIARKVTELAAARGDVSSELQAQLELGQALLRTPIGEGYNPNPTESDFDGASKAYLRALELATELRDDHSLAAAERKLATEMDSLTKESERETAEAQMLYGVHVYARAKIFPDLALKRGEEAYQAARRMGDRLLEFAAAGGLGMAHAEVGDEQEASEW